MLDAQTLTLMACAALLLVALWAIVAARAARAECVRLGGEGAGHLRDLHAARAEAGLARAAGEGQARLVVDRDARLADLAAEVAALRRQQGEAQAACAAAESRCARAGEAVARLEDAAARQTREHAEILCTLREDHAEVLRGQREEGARLADRLRAVEDAHSCLGAAHAKLQSERDERLASAEREVGRLRELREEMTREFRDLAARTLQETGRTFSDAHQQKLQELLGPFREQVGRFEAELREVHTTAKVDRELLQQQIVHLTTKTDAVSQEALNLTRALKGDKQRQGAWGEAQLERYLEHMGYQKGIDYVTQSSRTGEDGDRLRPDVILRMPGGKALVIDSKVSLVSYAAAIDAESEEERARHLKDHVRNVKARVDELAARGYQKTEDGAVDWVLLFMPIEGAVSAAWAHEADIGAYAMERGIGIAYPTTLLMALRTVKHLWDVENRNRHAESIAERAGLLYDKLANFIESFSAVGRALGSATAAHEKALGQLSRGSGNLVSQVEKLKKLGAKSSKSLQLAFDAEAEEEGEPRILGLSELDAPPDGIRPAE